MKLLMLCEWRRFSRWAAVIAVLNLAALFLLGRVSDPLRWSDEDQLAILVLCLLCGAGLAALQVGAYRRPSQWVWLIHRPLEARAIFAALALAALAVLALTIAAPALLWLAATDLMSPRVVDLRDYVAVLHLLAFAFMAWCIAVLAILARSKWVAATIALPLAVTLQSISVWWLALPVGLTSLWLLYIAGHALRADRDAPIPAGAPLVLTALPVQLGLFLLVFHLGKGAIEAAQFLIRPPVAGEVVTAADDAVAARPADPGLIVRGLQDASDPRAKAWRAQLPLSPATWISPDLERFPVRDQFGNLVAPWWDPRRGSEWTWSHDRMLFLGRNPRTGAAQGAWGRSGLAATTAQAEPFDQIPLDGLTRQALYVVDAERGLQHEVLRLPDDEWFIARPGNELGRSFVLSNRQLRAYRARSPDQPLSAPLALAWQLPLPEDPARLAQVDIAELLDGWLVSFFYFDPHDRLYLPWLQVLHVAADGRGAVVAERRGVHDIRIHTGVGGSALLPMEAWWLSPALHILASLSERAFDRGLTRPMPFEALPADPRHWALAALLGAIAVWLGARWLERTRASRRRRLQWLAMCALVGLPALLGMAVLEPRVTRAAQS